MHLTTAHVDDLPQLDADGRLPSRPDVAVVIDVIRAFTVAPWCLARGAERLLLAPSLSAAVRVREQRCPGALLLTDGAPDRRVELPNAPGRIAREDLTGRTVIQRTGNGTRGAYAVGRVPLLLCASFVTAGATARVLAGSGAGEVLLVPTEGDEDLALADYVTALVRSGADARVDAEPYLARVRQSAAARECRERGADPAYPGVDPEDLGRCLDLDAFDHALRASWTDGLLAVTRC